jgi:hypothetical protein
MSFTPRDGLSNLHMPWVKVSGEPRPYVRLEEVATKRPHLADINRARATPFGGCDVWYRRILKGVLLGRFVSALCFPALSHYTSLSRDPVLLTRIRISFNLSTGLNVARYRPNSGDPVRLSPFLLCYGRRIWSRVSAYTVPEVYTRRRRASSPIETGKIDPLTHSTGTQRRTVSWAVQLWIWSTWHVPLAHVLWLRPRRVLQGDPVAPIAVFYGLPGP